MCGDIFCGPCSSNRWQPHNVRVCGACFSRVTSLPVAAAVHEPRDGSDFQSPRREASQEAAAREIAMSGEDGPLPLRTPAAPRYRSEGAAGASEGPLLLGELERRIKEQQMIQVGA
jgi:hypothetical protein